MKQLIALFVVFLLCAASVSCANPNAEQNETESSAGTVASSPSESENETEPETESPHIHIPSGEWECNVKDHWQTCTEDNEKIQSQAHTLTENNVCTVCGGTILEYTDGSGWVTMYNERGQTIRATAFDVDGNKVQENIRDYVQDAKGTWYLAKTSEFDKAGNRIYIEEFNEYCDLTATSLSNLEGQVLQTNRFEREYDEQGNMLWERSYTNDILIQERYDFTTYKNDFGTEFFPKKIIDHYEDGSQVITLHDDRGLVINVATYLADGSIEHQTEYEHVYADHGGYERIRVYENGRLSRDTEYAISATLGITYVSQDTIFHEDGGKTLRTYNEHSQLVGEYIYDAAGNLIE